MWWSAYVGLPWHEREMNCWALVRRVYQEQRGVVLTLEPDRSYWQEVDAGEAWDVALYRMPCTTHVGVLIDRTRMLHIERGKDACIEKYRGYQWIRRLIGTYRWTG